VLWPACPPAGRSGFRQRSAQSTRRVRGAASSLTTSSAADCRPRLSPPARSPASSAAISVRESCRALGETFHRGLQHLWPDQQVAGGDDPVAGAAAAPVGVAIPGEGRDRARHGPAPKLAPVAARIAPVTCATASAAGIPSRISASTSSPHMCDGAAPCEAEIPPRESPRSTQPPTQRLPVAAAPPRAPVPGSCARSEKVMVPHPSCFLQFIMKILTKANYHDNFDKKNQNGQPERGVLSMPIPTLTRRGLGLVAAAMLATSALTAPALAYPARGRELP
jgi:hypothetical protein